MFRRYLFGADFFVSYARKDGTRYVAALARRLQQGRFSVFYDAYDTQPGQAIPRKVWNTLHTSSALIIVATPAARESVAMKEEIARFARIGRQILVVDVGQSARESRWWPLLDGIGTQPESATAMESSEPDAAIVAFLQNAFAYRRRNQRQQIVTGVFVSAIAAALIFLWVLNGRISVASAALRHATQELAQVAQERDRLNQAVATTREALHTASTERDQQQQLAEASRWVQQAETARAVLAYTPVPDVLRSLSAARLFQKAAMPSHAFAAVAESLAQVPSLVTSVQIQGGFRTHALTPDRRVLAILNGRDQAVLLAPALGARLYPAIDVGPDVTQLFLSADGARLGTIAGQRGVRIWDVRACALVYEGPCAKRGTLSARGALLVVECGDTIQVIDLAGRRQWGAIEHPDNFGDFRFTPDERYLAIIVRDESDSVLVYEVGDTLRPIRSTAGCLGGAQKISLSEDGRFALRSRRDVGEGVQGANSVRVCDLPSLRQVVALPHTFVTLEAISPDGRHVATLERGIVRLWNTSEGQLEASIRPAVPPGSITFTGDSRYLLTGSGWLMGVPDGQLAAVWMPADIPALMAPSAEGNRFLTADPHTGVLHIWQAQSIQKTSGFSFQSRATAAAMSADGHYFGVASVDPTTDGRPRPSITIWNATSGALLFSQQETDERSSSARTLAFAYRASEALVLDRRWDDETTLTVVGLEDGRRRFVYAPRKGTAAPPPPGSAAARFRADMPPAIFSGLAGHPALGWIGLERDNDAVRITSLSQQRIILERAVSDPEDCRLDDNGRLIVCPPAVYRTDQRAPVRVAAGLAILASRVSQSDDKVDAAVSGKDQWRLIELPSGRVRMTRPGAAEAAAISENGTFVAAGAAGLVRIWEVTTDRLMAEKRVAGPVVSLAFSADGRSLLATTPGQAQLWLWRDDDLIAAGCRLLTRTRALPGWRALFSAELLASACPAGGEWRGE